MQSATHTIGLGLQVINGTADTEIGPIFATLEQQIGAIVVGTSATLRAKRDHILTLAARFVLPTMSPYVPDVRGGALFSYGSDPLDAMRQVGAYTGRIEASRPPGGAADQV
jgi:hypothetical protein